MINNNQNNLNSIIESFKDMLNKESLNDEEQSLLHQLYELYLLDKKISINNEIIISNIHHIYETYLGKKVPLNLTNDEKREIVEEVNYLYELYLKSNQ